MVLRTSLVSTRFRNGGYAVMLAVELGSGAAEGREAVGDCPDFVSLRTACTIAENLQSRCPRSRLTCCSGRESSARPIRPLGRALRPSQSSRLSFS
ncbi:hypothetical protein DL98DRAFT_281860 [Cadophora sp. DSE1049]|nr:hypothetical protein DL98DRAFT_281860 [Cadophora sp. DSE1049]